MTSLQKRNIKPRDDRKYRKYRDNLRDLLKNEINRLINVIIKIYKPKRIIIEKLDFRSPELSKELKKRVKIKQMHKQMELRIFSREVLLGVYI
jgi:putative transposase